MVYHTKEEDPKGLTFQSNSGFEGLIYYEPGIWIFSFSNKIVVTVESLWRLIINNRITRTSFDHEQQFGLPEPLNLVNDLKDILNNKYLKEIQVIEKTGDLVLNISDNIQIEMLVTSSGYESYAFTFGNKKYIGGGSGHIYSHDL